MLPKSINYMGMVAFPPIPQKTESETNYPRQKSYLLEDDWAINT